MPTRSVEIVILCALETLDNSCSLLKHSCDVLLTLETLETIKTVHLRVIHHLLDVAVFFDRSQQLDNQKQLDPLLPAS